MDIIETNPKDALSNMVAIHLVLNFQSHGNPIGFSWLAVWLDIEVLKIIHPLSLRLNMEPVLFPILFMLLNFWKANLKHFTTLIAFPPRNI